MALTTLKVKHADPGRHADMHGLYLLVRDSGTRPWVLRMQHAGQRRDFGPGPAHEVPLADARIPSTLGRDALRLTVLTAVRSNETRKATWGEFDLDKAVWSIPGARMKMKEAHVVPLAPAAVKLPRALRQRHLELHGKVAECTNVPKEVADKALAHRIANAVEAAYRRTNFFDRRRVLMNEWAEFLLA